MNRFLRHALSAMGYDALSLGELELERGARYVRALRDSVGIPVALANVRFRASGEPLGEPVRVRKGDLECAVVGLFGPDLAAWRAHDPTALASSLSPGELALFIDCGTEDGFKFHDQAQHLHEILDAAKIPHTFALVPGPHDFSLWKVRIRESLAFHADHFRRAGL